METVSFVTDPMLIGVFAAIIHVLTGPDHIAAVTPLVFDSRKKHWRIGVFWGVGHVFGMLLIGVLFYFFKDYIPIENISMYSEKFVGIILIGIGLWAIYSVVTRRNKHKHAHFHNAENNALIHKHNHIHTPHKHHHKHKKLSGQSHFTALWVGVLHGFAGIAHFVLLLPVLGFSSKTQSFKYIIGFAVGTIFAMFAYTYIIGKFNRKELDNQSKPLYRYLQFWSGVFAIGIGIFWFLSVN
jgi:ABC-type nickel/cobalt efflux system permease component RcnA